MSYNAQVVIRARQRLEQAKAEKEALQQQRLTGTDDHLCVV